jgi:hypothetical protein
MKQHMQGEVKLATLLWDQEALRKHSCSSKKNALLPREL